MNREQWLTLPEPVRDFIWDAIDPCHEEIGSKFGLNNKQLNFIRDLEDRLFLKKMEVLDFPQQLANLPQGDNIDLRSLALEISNKLLWPLNDFLSNIDRLILRLGGKVPMPIHLKGALAQKKTFPSGTTSTVRQLLSEYDDFKELRLSGKKIIDNNGRFIMPSVDNWLKDYIHFLGAGYHNSLQRAQYLAKAPNALDLSTNERENLRNFLLSYDDNVLMYWELSEGLLQVKIISKDEKIGESKKIDLEVAVSELQNNLKSIEQLVLPEDFIMSEAGNDFFKLRDVLWQALGVQDKVKILSCLKVLSNRKSLDAMLAEDSRYRSILKRFISVRYGSNLDNWLDNNLDKLLTRRLFLEMILQEKMHLVEAEATIIAFYLTNLWPQSGQVVYLDKNDGQLKWRLLQLVINQITWVE